MISNTLDLDTPPPPLIEFEEDLTNEYGSVRRSKVYNSFKNNNLTKEEITYLYTEWRDDPEYFILRGIVEDNTEQKSLIHRDFDPYYTWELPPDFYYLYRFVKASKRGNDVYKSLVKKKLKPLKDLNEVIFFEDHEVNKRTSLLFVTLTYDNNRCSFKKAWENFGKEYHLFCSNLKKQYGDIEIFRTWESTKKYYPHVHMAILFRDRDFPVIIHINKEGKREYRIPQHEKDKMSSYYHSFIDVQALQSTSDCFRELTKYITKDLCSKKGDITNSMIWLFRKQSYSVSKKFIEAVNGWYIDFNEPTNRDLINDMCNCNQDNIKWEFLGILRGKDLGFFSDLWVVDLKKPPPRVLTLIENERIRWNRLHSKRNNFCELFNFER